MSYQDPKKSQFSSGKRRLWVLDAIEDKRGIESYHRVFAATNHDHFGQVSSDNRRFFMLNVSNHRKVDRAATFEVQKKQNEYWQQFYSALRDGKTIPALLHHLSHLDISDFNVNQFPSTRTHQEQKLKSLTGIARFLFEALSRGEMIRPAYTSNTEREWGDGYWISTAKFKEALLDFDKSVERYGPLSDKEAIASIKQAIPLVEASRKTDVDQHQRRGIDFPSLTAARTCFEAVWGLIDYEWDE